MNKNSIFTYNLYQRKMLIMFHFLMKFVWHWKMVLYNREFSESDYL